MNRRTLGLLMALSLGLGSGCSVMVERGPGRQPAVATDFSDPVLRQRRVFVVGEITGPSAAETIRQLLFLDAQNDQPVDLYLMTPGGDLQAAFGIARTFRLLRSRVNTYALGECNSSGALLLAAGTGVRRAFPDSTIVLHGMTVKHDPPAEYVHLSQEAYTSFWRSHARLPDSWLPIPSGRVIVLSAQRALELGVIDQIESSSTEGPKPRGSAR